MASFDAAQYLRNYPELEPAFKDHSVLSAYDDPLEAAAAHYELYGKNEGRTSKSNVMDIGSKSETTMDKFQIAQFEDLLEKLESSKKRQQRQRAVEKRRDIFAGGLAGMMDNF